MYTVFCKEAISKSSIKSNLKRAQYRKLLFVFVKEFLIKVTFRFGIYIVFSWLISHSDAKLDFNPFKIKVIKLVLKSQQEFRYE